METISCRWSLWETPSIWSASYLSTVWLRELTAPRAASESGGRGNLAAVAHRTRPATSSRCRRQHSWATGPPSEDRGERRLTAPVAAGAVSLPELVRQLDAAGLRAEDVSIRRPTLDEVFLDRTVGPEQPAAAA